MLEHMKKPHTEETQVFLGVICQQAMLDEVKAVLASKGCTIKQEEKEWYSLEELFPNHHAGDSIRGLRYREELTQKQLAEMVGISVQNLSHMENGRRPVGKEMAKRLAAALNADWRTFLR